MERKVEKLLDPGKGRSGKTDSNMCWQGGGEVGALLWGWQNVKDGAVALEDRLAVPQNVN